MSKPPNYENPVEYLTLPTYYHVPLQVGHHEIPIYGSEVRVGISTGPDGHFLTVTIQSRCP